VLTNFVVYVTNSVTNGFIPFVQCKLTFSTLKWEYNGTVHQLFVDFKKTYDSVSREVLYNILIGSGVTMKLIG
jgi:hypothetical protein